MAATFSFSVPSAIPQDLQLIHDIVGPTPVASSSKIHDDTTYSDHDHGTDSDTDSEQEVEADILGVEDDAKTNGYVLLSFSCIPFQRPLGLRRLSRQATRTYRATLSRRTNNPK